MLQNLREHAQGWIAGIIVTILVLAFALWGIQYYIGADGTSQTVAKVNGQIITQHQLANAYQRFRQQQPSSSALTLNQQAQKELRQRILQQLIEKKLLAEAAIKAGYRISTELINAVILQTPAFQINGQFSAERYGQVLNALLFSPQEFAEDVAQSLLVLQVQAGIVASDFALPNEINDFIRLADQKRDFGYFIIPAAHFLNSVNISEQDIQKFYDSHQNDFLTPEQISIQYIELSANALAAKQQVTNNEIKQFYQNNIGNFTTPEQWQVARILISSPTDANAEKAAQARIQEIQKQLQSGKSFADVAKQYSNDNISAAKGGMMGWISRNQQSPLFMQVVANLQPNQISKPFKSTDGYNIVKLIAVKKAQVLPLVDVQEKIRKALQQQKIEQAFSDQSDKLTNLTYTNPDTLNVAAETLGLPIQTTALFTRQGLKTGIAANPKIITAAFSDNVLKQNNNSEPVQINGSTLVVLRIKQHKAATIRSLDEVRQQIVGQLKAQVATAQAQDLGKKVIAEIKAGKSPEQVAKQFNLIWRQQVNVSRQQAGIAAQILRTAFSLPQPSSKQPSVAGLAMPTGDYAVVKLLTVADANPVKANAQEQEVTSTELSSSWGHVLYSLYVDAAKKHAKIKINQPLVSAE